MTDNRWYRKAFSRLLSVTNWAMRLPRSSRNSIRSLWMALWFQLQSQWTNAAVRVHASYEPDEHAAGRAACATLYAACR